MTRQLSLLSILMLLVLSCVSCERSTTQPAVSDLSGSEKNVPSWLESQEHLESMWMAGENMEYVSIEGEINVIKGGTLSGVPPTWPAGYHFSIVVEPNSVVLEKGQDPVLHFVIEVPSADPVNWTGYMPAVFKLEPDGQQFVERVTVTFCYPQWLNADSKYFHKYCLTQTLPAGPGDVLVYGTTDYERFSLPPGSCPHVVTFTTNHFSHWVLENGKGGEDGG